MISGHVARTPGRPTLRFSQSSHHTIEALYRTHWVSSALGEKKRERLAEKASRPPELVVLWPLNTDWTCHRCGGGGDGALLIMENPGPARLPCVGLGDLAFLPTGDARLTRRAKAKSQRSAVVVRFSRGRGGYERQGLLVEPLALARGLTEIEAAGEASQPSSRQPMRACARAARGLSRQSE